MAFPVSFRPLAQDDVEDALSWYAEERPALALGFAESQDAVITRIGETPYSFQQCIEKCDAHYSVGFRTAYSLPSLPTRSTSSLSFTFTDIRIRGRRGARLGAAG
jgi:plasmid stabilization system protein ParE